MTHDYRAALIDVLRSEAKVEAIDGEIVFTIGAGLIEFRASRDVVARAAGQWWQPIEAAPKDGSYFLFPFTAYQSDGSEYYQVGTCLWIERNKTFYQLTPPLGRPIRPPKRWMPIPPPPEEI